MSEGYVYFIGTDDWRLNRVKIGFTRNGPKARLADMQTGSPFKLRVLGAIGGDMVLERLLHETFAPLREHGEWFRLEGRLLALVSNLFCETHYGEVTLSPKAGEQFLNKLIFDETIPDGVFCSVEEWEGSADTETIGQWLHDRAWAEYQLDRAQ